MSCCFCHLAGWAASPLRYCKDSGYQPKCSCVYPGPVSLSAVGAAQFVSFGAALGSLRLSLPYSWE